MVYDPNVQDDYNEYFDTDVNYCSVCFKDTVFYTEPSTGKAVCDKCRQYLFPDEVDEFDDTDDIDSSSPYW